MRKIYYLFVMLQITSLPIALLVLLLYITQSMNIQIIPLQSLYWSLDKSWGWERAITNLLMALSSNMIIVLHFKKQYMSANIREISTFLIITIMGLILGSAVHYTHSCCEMPVVFYFGFPFSWWRGVTGSMNVNSSSGIEFLLQQSNLMKLHIILWGVIGDLFFWLNSGFLFVTLFKLTKNWRARSG